MIRKLREFDWMKYGFQLAIVGLFSVCGLLYAQQNTVIEHLNTDMKAHCSESKEMLKEKVDNKTLLLYMKNQDAKIKHNKDQWDKQDRTNEKLLNSVQDLNENVILLNEKMKDKI